MRIQFAWLLRPGITKQVRCYGYQARLDSTYLIDGIYLMLEAYDPDFDDLCRAVLEPGAVIVDIGCHAGLTMFSALQSVGGEARVYGFEPDPTHYRRCLANLELNPTLREKVTVEPVALSDHDHQLRFVETAPPRGTYCVNGDGNESSQARSLDSWVAEQGLTQLNLLKSDVEGHEAEVLAGARETVARFRPTLFFESIFLQGLSQTSEIFKWLEQLDYVVVGSHYPYPYPEPGGRLPLDLIACPKERWLSLHQRLMKLGQARRSKRSWLRSLVDSWRHPLS